MTDTDEPVVVGRIGAPHGVRGWVNVQSFTTPPENILHYRPWLIEPGPGPGQPRRQRVDDLEVVDQGGRLRVRFPGVADRDAATTLRGRLIAVPAAALPAPAADEYYWRDLIGLTVLDGRGQCLGRVRELLETGADDVLVVAADAGGEILIPFHRKFVHQIDLKEKTIVVDWLEAEP